MTPNGLGLDTADKTQGFELIPVGTLCELVMRIRAGTFGIEGLLKCTSKGDAEYLDVEYTVRAGPFAKRKLFDIMILNGTTDGHGKASKISRSLLRAIFESVHGIDPHDTSPAATSQRANATLAGFHGATFLATVDVEKGNKRPDGSGEFKDKNIIGRVLRVGDRDYRKLDQPPPAPIERSVPPASPTSPYPASASPGGAHTTAAPAIAKPSWAE
jgi:hypothetical protein